ncbi:hypothetical protein T11_15943 [Trichinella zimbabwensis]|uniref:Uncharacterized protein n=1 Tax=Trichinella zimbabwensis TaxID=268475 RepID=A0A0V1GF64_9BILA|nr:hypothetical protein T11_15943 [Trichinella zimbabwensis]
MPTVRTFNKVQETNSILLITWLMKHLVHLLLTL